MKKHISIVITMLILFSFMNISANDAIPDTPVGEKLKLFLETIESGDHESFITNNFADNFLNQFPLNDHLSFFRQVKEMHGGFEIYKIIRSDDFQLVALVKSKKRGAWRQLEIAIEQIAPHKIEGIGLDNAQPPADIAYTGKKYDQVSTIQPDPNLINQGDIASKIDTHLSMLEQRGYSGAVLVAQKGKVLISKGYGYANRDKKIPFHTSSAFDIGSIAKQFTGAAIVKLEMMGKLSTNDLLTKYFQHVPDDKKDITLHHLLTHSAGFPGAIGYDYDSTSIKEFSRLALASKLLFEPGERYEYSNVGYSILAIIIEQVTGESYEKFLHDNLFIPANMNATGYVLPNWNDNQVVHGYNGEEHFGQPNKKNWDSDGPWWHLRGNGGIISTVHDMYKWHLALENDNILSPDAKKKYYTPHIIEQQGGNTFYGYGWVITESSRGTKVYMHNGGNPYFANDCYRYIDDDVFVYITSNNGQLPAIEQSGTILRIIFK